jgi:phosphotriesterase-related protein
MTPFENAVLQAAAMAAKQTGIPVVVHAANDEMGDRQQALLIEYGVPANRIVLEHGFNTPDQEHHLRILNEGSYIGIDRIGGGGMASAENFATLMMALINKGRVSQIIVSNNSSSNRCRDWLSSAKVPAYAGSCFNSGSFHDTMIPMLKFMGADDRQIEIMLIDNPRRFFSNGPLPQSV